MCLGDLPPTKSTLPVFQSTVTELSGFYVAVTAPTWTKKIIENNVWYGFDILSSLNNNYYYESS